MTPLDPYEALRIYYLTFSELPWPLTPAKSKEMADTHLMIHFN